MGCDYYIVKYLRIYFEDDYLSMEIERERGYYLNIYDEDEDEDEEEYRKECLIPKMKPIIIYDKLNKSNYETKYEARYKSIVEQFMKDCGREFSDITKMIKMEARHERS